TATLADRIGVRLACEVVSVETAAGGARVRYKHAWRAAEISSDGLQTVQDAGVGFGPVEVIEADAALVAVPGVLVGNLCPSLTPGERDFFREVRYGRGMIVFLMLDEAPSTLPYYGVAFPRCEGLDLYGLAVDHHKMGVAPAGTGLLNVALTATAAARMWN